MQCLTNRIRTMIDRAVANARQEHYDLLCRSCAAGIPAIGKRYEERVAFMAGTMWGWVHFHEDENGGHWSMCQAFKLRDACEEEPYAQKYDKPKRAKK